MLSEFCDADRLKFFKFVTGLTAIPVTRPGAAKPFQLLAGGKEQDQPPAVGVGVLLPAPLSGVPDQGDAHEKATPAIHETEGFDQG